MKLKTHLSRKNCLKKLHAALPDSTIPDVKEIFIQDVIRLGSVFDMTKHSKMTLQILPVNSNMCRLFHEDYYRNDCCAHISVLEQNGSTTTMSIEQVSAEVAMGYIVKDPARINRANTFDVILLKGARSESGFGWYIVRPLLRTRGRFESC